MTPRPTTQWRCLYQQHSGGWLPVLGVFHSVKATPYTEKSVAGFAERERGGIDATFDFQWLRESNTTRKHASNLNYMLYVKRDSVQRQEIIGCVTCTLRTTRDYHDNEKKKSPNFLKLK
ncbi:hypothetical protein CPC08DRAFT_33323 [Agrocybe pediades]|nr:hypothetical protein CPC08DRAFT_33323 [Agrocybe pediades]